MEITFVGSSADKIFWEAYKNFTLENSFYAERVFKDNFDLEQFNNELDYLREIRSSKFSEAEKMFNEGKIEEVSKIIGSLLNEIQLKIERYEVALPIIHILKNRV